MPQAILLAGLNGAGKTTFARQLVPALHPQTLFLNADEIQRELGCHPVGAGRELLHRISEAREALRPFVVETTLSTKLYAPKIRLWKARGFETILHSSSSRPLTSRFGVSLRESRRAVTTSLTTTCDDGSNVD